MSTVTDRPTVSADAPPDGITPGLPVPFHSLLPLTLTITHYQQLAANFTAALDAIAASIPPLEASHISTVKFVRSHLNVSTEFLSTVISAVEQTPALQGVQKLDVGIARDTLQFIDAFRPVLDKLLAFADSLKFTMDSRKASLVADSFQIYEIAKGVARDPGSAAVASLVANMKRDLGRRGATKAKTAARKAAAPLAAAASPPEVTP